MKNKDLQVLLSEFPDDMEVLVGGHSNAHNRDMLSRASVGQEDIHRDSMGYPMPHGETRRANAKALVIRRTVFK